jgi:hypothetical protein
MVETRVEKDAVRTTLEELKLPEVGSVWVGPYEQLHGAGFSLLAATRHRIYERDFHDYHKNVRAKIVALILEHDATGQVHEKAAFDNAIAGFYFNAAIQRIVWASERLIKTFIGVPCICGRPAGKHADSRKFRDLLGDAHVRIRHLRSEDNLEMEQMNAMVSQFPNSAYERKSLFDAKYTLSMLRYDVNNRKHSIFGPLILDRKTARKNCAVDPKTWSAVQQDVQMHLACQAFKQVSFAYNELRDWQPTASTGLVKLGKSK